MCPSYMVTHEEKHSTRGRTHLLFEMMHHEELTRGWHEKAVHEALDLCLACKGCKSDCPMNVDMATYKAEFLSHYYEHRLRPRSGYAMGLIYWWARLASQAAAHRELRDARARAVVAVQVDRRRRAEARRAALRRRALQEVVEARAPVVNEGSPAGDPVAGHLQQLHDAVDLHRRGRGARVGRLSA